MVDQPLYARGQVTGADHERLQSLAARRLNIGCGDYPLPYFTNVDADPAVPADCYVSVPPMPGWADGSMDEIYAGHFLEHLARPQAQEFLRECYRILVPGGRLGLVVPDTREIMRRWLEGAIDVVEYPRGHFNAVADLDDVCSMFLYSPLQTSPHLWSYDLGTLGRAMTAAGFTVTGEIDRYRDPRITVGAFYQCGLEAIKP